MQAIINAGAIAGALLTVATFIAMFVKWVILKPIKLYIDQATAQIAPNANGGRSLNDLIDKVEDLKTMLREHVRNHDTPK